MAAPTGSRRRSGRGGHRRKPFRMPRVDGLDGLRILSAVAVVIYHLLGEIVGGNPTAGVVLPTTALIFFVITGYVIYRPFLIAHVGGTPQPPMAPFYLSRLLRVLPLWWIAVAVKVSVFGAGSVESVRDWFLTLTLLQVLDLDIRYSIIGPAWALSTEWLFYLSAPLWARFTIALRRGLAPRMRTSTFQLLALIPVTAFCLLGAGRPFIATIIGVAFAIIDVERARTGRTPAVITFLRSPALIISVTAVVWGALVFYPYGEGLSVQWAENDLALLTLWMLPAGLWIIPVVFGSGRSRAVRILSHPRSVQLANLTFGIYLWHDLFIKLILRELGADVNLAAAFLITFVGGFTLAALTFVGLEEPLLRARKRWGAARAPLPPPIVSADIVRSPRPVVALEGLRVVTAVLVAVHLVVMERADDPAVLHASQALGVLCTAVFLVISGFVRYRPHALGHARLAAPPGRWGDVARRVLRLYPLYWCLQIIGLVQNGTEHLDGVIPWVQTVTAFPFPDTTLLSEVGIGAPAHFLSVLVLFELLLPVHSLLVEHVRPRSAWWPSQLVPLAMTSVFVMFLGTTGPAGALLPATLVGMGFAVVEVGQRRSRRRLAIVRRLAPAWGTLLLGATAIMGLDVAFRDLPDPIGLVGMSHGHLAAASLAALLILFPIVLGPPRSSLGRLLRHPVTAAPAPATYGMFLIIPAVLTAYRGFDDLPPWALLGIAVTIGVVGGTAGDKLVTTPVRSLGPRPMKHPGPMSREVAG